MKIASNASLEKLYAIDSLDVYWLDYLKKE